MKTTYLCAIAGLALLVSPNSAKSQTGTTVSTDNLVEALVSRAFHVGRPDHAWPPFQQPFDIDTESLDSTARGLGLPQGTFATVHIPRASRAAPAAGRRVGRYCYAAPCADIDVPNLVSLEFLGDQLNAPSLVAVSLTYGRDDQVGIGSRHFVFEVSRSGSSTWIVRYSGEFEG